MADKVKLKVYEEVTYELEVDAPDGFEGMDDDERQNWADKIVIEKLDPIGHCVSVDEREVEIQC